MLKITYLTPSVRVVEICSESAFLALSDPSKNPYYSLDYDGEDDEFTL